MPTVLTPERDHQGIEWTARFVQWGRGKWHVQPVGSSVTACDKELPDQVRVTIYSCAVCAHCRTHTELYEAAEEYRKALNAYGNQKRDERIAAARSGRFTVYRCKLCGCQHQRPAGEGVPYCLAAHHEADLEVLEAIGPAWGGKFTP
jgi:hypothetical protein